MFDRTPERTIRKRQQLRLLDAWIEKQAWAIPGSCWDLLDEDRYADLTLAYRCCCGVMDSNCRDSRSMMRDMFGYGRLETKVWRRLYTWHLLCMDLSL